MKGPLCTGKTCKGTTIVKESLRKSLVDQPLLRMFRKTASAVLSLNGGRPVRNSYRQTPRAHQSTGGPATNPARVNISDEANSAPDVFAILCILCPTKQPPTQSWESSPAKEHRCFNKICMKQVLKKSATSWNTCWSIWEHIRLHLSFIGYFLTGLAPQPLNFEGTAHFLPRHLAQSNVNQQILWNFRVLE